MEILQLNSMLTRFLEEDIGYGDLSANAIFDTQMGTAQLVSRQDGVFAGGQLLTVGYKLLNNTISVTLHVKDGEWMTQGTILAEIKGAVRDILKGERVLLNLLQRMSGIATLTHRAIKMLDDPSIYLCDTRKTTPGLRMLEKYAVRMGGGKNHRFGLDDGVMVKDNHIAVCGSIRDAVAKARVYVGHMVKIEVEIETEEQLEDAIAAGADVIMFDNCTPEQVMRYNSITPEHIITEASGGITLDTLPYYRHTGVNYISLGFITHSAPALDIGLDMAITHQEASHHGSA
ncbi:carboxylating nicotinate-nucleotide diphosphorylase [Xenorhabdus budapestensis]|uniref:Probable nicotinate-nucleotide pyrophosphorylase [carboxylating] n=1 Tax=Xenorhabdus budapestensis TaxID=290110 RepID=A0A2D0J323_XENBU|nr:carboxylating nicotinate-nucleotide diphosphorylase [Xenorhabdus budapestensis]PHM28729.1 putative nicotinate-nucleotide pyrophosphorylase [Xenorhabdus budapestensis]